LKNRFLSLHFDFVSTMSFYDNEFGFSPLCGKYYFFRFFTHSRKAK